MLTKKRIVVVEDDCELSAVLAEILGSCGYAVSTCGTGEDALEIAGSDAPDLFIVDLGLPDIDGLSLVREFRNNIRYGLIILSGRSGLSDRVLGLELGADDYLAKPFEPRELVARVKSVLRRSDILLRSTSNEQKAKLKFGRWTFDIGRLSLKCEDGREENLTAAESSLLLAMLKSPNRVLSREQLQQSDRWNDDPGFERSIDVRISRLRKKIEDDPGTPRLIKTIYGAGYMFAVDVRWEDGNSGPRSVPKA